MQNEIILTEKQIEAFKKLWFIYGNNGKKSTMLNHKLVQGFYQYRENRISAYKEGNKNIADKFGNDYALKNGVTDECIKACEDILNVP